MHALSFHVFAMCSLFCSMALSSLRIAVLIPNWRNFCPGFYICSSIYFYLFIKLFLFIIFFLPLSHLALVWHAQSLWLGCRLGMPVRCSRGIWVWLPLQPLGPLPSLVTWALRGIDRIPSVTHPSWTEISQNQPLTVNLTKFELVMFISFDIFVK